MWRVLLLTAALSIAADASAQEGAELNLIRDLRSEQAGDRRRAAKQARKLGRLGPQATLELMAAAERERDPGTYEALLLALGDTGAIEARPLIDRHILSVDKSLRNVARRALQAWLLKNALLREGRELPAPPHLIYGPPPLLHPAVPAAHSLQAQLDSAPAGPDGRTSPPPIYLPPPPGAPYAYNSEVLGTAAGFHQEQELRLGLVISGAATLGAGYLIGAVIGIIGVASADKNKGSWAPAFIPVAGPFITLGTAEVFEGRAGSVFGGLGQALAGLGLVVSGLAQTAGAVLLPIGLAATRDVERRDAWIPELTVAPGQGTLRVRF
jgi:hypothetical protein